MYLLSLLQEPGVSLCFRGFLGARKKAGHCGQYVDARSAMGHEVEEGAPQLCMEGLPGVLTKHGLFLLTLLNPHGYPPKQLVRLTSQDGKTMLQFLRVKLTSSLVCAFTYTPALPVANTVASTAFLCLLCISLPLASYVSPSFLPEPPPERLLISNCCDFLRV